MSNLRAFVKLVAVSLASLALYLFLLASSGLLALIKRMRGDRSGTALWRTTIFHAWGRSRRPNRTKPCGREGALRVIKKAVAALGIADGDRLDLHSLRRAFVWVRLWGAEAGRCSAGQSSARVFCGSAYSSRQARISSLAQSRPLSLA